MPARVSIVIPAYRSQATLSASIESMLNQDWPNLEIVFIDSSPDDEAARTVPRRFPAVVFLHVGQRLLPHAARNLGAERATGDLFLFTDPDIYAPPGWVRRLVATREAYGGATAAALACHGRKWFDRGVHLAKFDQCLPRAGVHVVSLGATAGLLCRRDDFTGCGGFDGNRMLGDTLFSWQLSDAGIVIRLDGSAVAEHHHLTSLSAFIRERRERGREFAGLYSRRRRMTRRRLVRQLVVTILPLRLGKWLLRTLWRAVQARRLGEFLLVAPIVFVGHAAWLAGEALGYRRLLQDKVSCAS